MTNYEIAVAELPNRRMYDLQDYNNWSLSAAGELAVSPYFVKPIYLTLGRDLLELSKVSLPGEGDRAESATVAYILRNLGIEGSEAVMLDDGLIAGEEIDTPNMGTMRLLAGQYRNIGRYTTPELGLSDQVDAEHLQLRIGTMSGNVHFADLDSENGSVVYLDKQDSRMVSPPRRMWHIVKFGDEMIRMTKEAVNQRWSRLL